MNFVIHEGILQVWRLSALRGIYVPDMYSIPGAFAQVTKHPSSPAKVSSYLPFD